MRNFNVLLVSKNSTISWRKFAFNARTALEALGLPGDFGVLSDILSEDRICTRLGRKQIKMTEYQQGNDDNFSRNSEAVPSPAK